jgi:hypothetical protein
MNFIILTRLENSSPYILALSLKHQLECYGHHAKIVDGKDTLNWLVNYKNSGKKFHFWFLNKIKKCLTSVLLLNKIRKYDAVILSECTPNGFWPHLYNIEKLKRLIKVPIFYYEVYHIENAPSMISSIKPLFTDFIKRYDGHLFISPVTEIRGAPLPNAFCIGLMAKTWNLQPHPKKELLALVDFAQPGYEVYREMQIRQLGRAGIPYISLEQRYTIDEIRDIYRSVSIYFVQSYEAFGLPILECLCTGAQVFTPDSGWPMSWRLDDDPQVHGEGLLPPCFTVYEGEDDLLQKLISFKQNYCTVETPKEVFSNFIKNYPCFYEGNKIELENWVNYIKNLID